MIAAPQGRSGKTTVSLGICAALVNRGLRVQAFKKGPDYIDPSWLSAACGNDCRSLDSFFLSNLDDLKQAFLKGSQGANFILIEGNHGLYDSIDPDGHGSSAATARTLDTPVILVINAARMSRSAAAMVHGYQTFEPDTPIKAVILNNVAQTRHEEKLRQAIETYCRIPVLGALPRSDRLTIPDRHLGLVPHGESADLPAAIEACRREVEANVDLNALVEIANQSSPIASGGFTQVIRSVRTGTDRVRLGVIRDRAFSFYYPENLEALEEAGAELFFIDALHDSRIPTIDGLVIGGGFPELFMEQLSANQTLRKELKERAAAGLPVYAECGGLMYLARRIHWGSQSAEMVGALPIEVEMTDLPQGHGYVQARCDAKNPFFPIGTTVRGHEFHHSRLIQMADTRVTVLQLDRGVGMGAKRDGLVSQNILACYTHLHAGGTPAWAPAVVKAAELFRTRVVNGCLS